jgi:hypothetical protein
VICGHVHRQAVLSESTGFGGKLQTIMGVEAGHMMNVSRADYLKGGIANWARWCNPWSPCRSPWPCIAS